MPHAFFGLLLYALAFCSCNPLDDLSSKDGPSAPAVKKSDNAAGASVYVDSFDGTKPLPWTPHSRAAVENGVLRVSKGNEAMTSWIPPKVVNGRFSVSATFGAGDKKKPFGVVFRQSDSTNYYYFHITGDGDYSLGRMIQGKSQTLIGWKNNARVIRPGQNRVEVDFSGFLIRCEVNDELLVHAYLDGYGDTVLPGQTALFADSGISVRYDDVKLVDYQAAPNLTGVITQEGKPKPGTPARLYLMVDAERMEGRFMDAQLADGAGRYAFHFPVDGIYLVEAGATAQQYAAGQGAYGARFVDSPIEENEPLERPIELVYARGGAQ